MAEDFYRVVGSNIRARRLSMDWSLERLAKRLGVSYQQVQKYEKGMNRIPSHMLAELAVEFGCSVDELCGLRSPAYPPELLGAFQLIEGIASPAMRRRVLALIEAAAGIEDAA